MSEHIFSDEQIRSERRQAYEAGKRQRERWTGRDYHGEEIVRCCDCIYLSDDGLTTAWCNENCREVRPRDFCAWGWKDEA